MLSAHLLGPRLQAIPTQLRLALNRNKQKLKFDFSHMLGSLRSFRAVQGRARSQGLIEHLRLRGRDPQKRMVEIGQMKYQKALKRKKCFEKKQTMCVTFNQNYARFLSPTSGGP
jgi:hypothetical protein